MTNLTHGARPTLYRGIRMRSRTEAQVAAWLDVLGLAWEYEPDCFADRVGQYLPDFRISYRSGRRLYLEVKGSDLICDAEAVTEQMEIIWTSEPDAQLMLLFADTGDCFIADPAQWEGWQHQTTTWFNRPEMV